MSKTSSIRKKPAVGRYLSISSTPVRCASPSKIYKSLIVKEFYHSSHLSNDLELTLSPHLQAMGASLARPKPHGSDGWLAASYHWNRASCLFLGCLSSLSGDQADRALPRIDRKVHNGRGLRSRAFLMDSNSRIEGGFRIQRPPSACSCPGKAFGGDLEAMRKRLRGFQFRHASARVDWECSSPCPRS